MLATVLYPFAIYFLGGMIPVSYMLMGLLGLLVVRSVLQYKSQLKSNMYMTLMIIAIMLGLFSWDQVIAAYLYPVMVSLSFASLLGWSLLYPPSLIERFARIMEPDLDEHGVAYTRKVTMIWLAFSLANASISFVTASIDDKDLWLLYNGLVSYILIGLLMGGEFLFRQYYKSKRKTA